MSYECESDLSNKNDIVMVSKIFPKILNELPTHQWIFVLSGLPHLQDYQGSGLSKLYCTCVWKNVIIPLVTFLFLYKI